MLKKKRMRKWNVKSADFKKCPELLEILLD